MQLPKDTTSRLITALVLIFFSFLNPCLANTNYQSSLILTKNRAPIEQVRSYRDGLIYSNQGQLYFNKDRINLLNSSESSLGLKVNDIYIDQKDFYLATDIGIFYNYRRIFSKEACNQVIKTPSQIFIACKQGIYTTKVQKKTLQASYDWQLDVLSPQNPNYISLNQSRSNVQYASADNGFYYQSRGKWFNRSYGLKRDFQDSFGFGRFLNHNGIIYLTTSSGVFTSDNSGKSWVKNNTGLEPDSDGFYQLRQINIDSDQLLLISSQGLYQSQINSNLNWQEIKIEGSQKATNYQNNFYSLDPQELFLSNSQGQIFKLSKETISLPNQAQNNIQEKTIARIIKAEPKIQDLHQVALAFAGIPTGAKFRSYKRQARLRNLVPDFEAFAERDDQDILALETQSQDSFNSNTSSINSGFDQNNLDRNDNQINTGIRFKWSLSNLIYDPEINDINTSARITANTRENILTELTQIYYSRKELIYKLLKNKLETNQTNNFSDKLKLEEYTAQLDARTGAWFSQELHKTIRSIVKDLDIEIQDKILALYT